MSGRLSGRLELLLIDLQETAKLEPEQVAKARLVLSRLTALVKESGPAPAAAAGVKEKGQ
jgi:hypothetical protein